MGNTSSQSETPTTTSQSQDEWKPIRLCGTLPTEVVPAERYVRQLWQALDMTHEMAQCGLRSDTPVGQGGTLDTETYTINFGCDATGLTHEISSDECNGRPQSCGRKNPALSATSDEGRYASCQKMFSGSAFGPSSQFDR